MSGIDTGGNAFPTTQAVEPYPVAWLDKVKTALPEFEQNDDYLLAHGASLMSDTSHEIIHVDTVRKVVDVVLSAPTKPLSDEQIRQISQSLRDRMHEDSDGWGIALSRAVIAEFCRVNCIKETS